MASPLFSEIEASTTEAYVKGLVSRTLFTTTPWLRVLRSNKSIYRPWQGGSYHKAPFDVQPSPSGAYSPGTDTFSLQQVQNIDDMMFAPKFYEAEVVINAAVTDVYNMGPSVIFNLLKEKYGNASNSLDSKLAAAVYNAGQASSTYVATNRIKQLNGFAEGINDGITPSWDGNVYQTYGNQTRNTGLVQQTLNSVPYFGGNSDGTLGSFSAAILNKTYNFAKQGKGEGSMLGGKPEYGLTSDYAYGIISNLIFPHQRVDAEVKEPRLGLTGMKFNNAVIFPDSYSPGVYNSRFVLDASVISSITTGSIVNTGGNTALYDDNQTLSNFPTNAVSPVYVGETFWWVRPDTWRFSYPRTGAYAFKPRGLQEAFDGDIRADIIRAAIVMYCLVPASNILTYGYGS